RRSRARVPAARRDPPGRGDAGGPRLPNGVRGEPETHLRLSGGEIGLLEAGLVPAGVLDARKARIVLTLALSFGRDPAEVFAHFAWVSLRFVSEQVLTTSRPTVAAPQSSGPTATTILLKFPPVSRSLKYSGALSRPGRLSSR